MFFKTHLLEKQSGLFIDEIYVYYLLKINMEWGG